MTASTATLPAPRTGRVRTPSDFGSLLAEVQRNRLLDRSWAGYLPRALAITAMIAAGVVALVWIGPSWWQLAVAGYFGVIFAQLGFLGHDAGHQQIFRSRRWNDHVGRTISNLGVGLSYGWWVEKHNRHHSHPNHVGRDPDVARNVLAWTPGQAMEQRGALRGVVRHQALLFFPLLLLEGWNLHVGSMRVLMRNPRKRLGEIALLAAHPIFGITVLLVVMSPLQAVAFVAVQQSVFGFYLGCSFAPNHKGMPVVDGVVIPDFLRRQVLTSRNLTGGRAMSILFGGLNYQIEHHLFPSMPSRNLRRVRPIVKEFCAERGIAYCETNLFGSYARVLSYLRSLRPASP